MRTERFLVWGGIVLLLALAGLGLFFMMAQNDESAEEEAAFCDDAGPVFNVQLNVGDVAPDFKLPDHKGGFVRLSDFMGESNVVLVFYPAAWTPV